MGKIKEKTKQIIDNKTILSVFLSIFATATLVMAMLTTSYSFYASVYVEYLPSMYLYASLTFGFLTGVYLLTIVKLRGTKKMFKYIFYASISLLITIFMSIFGLNYFAHQFLICAFYCALIVGQAISVIIDHRKRNIIVAILFLVADIFLIASTFEMGAETTLYETIAMLMISANCIGFILIEALAKIQLTKLSSIIRKTYALEIMLGLFSLIISFSFVFMLMENMTYGDALWYCFAIVTTIGFGDIAATGVIGRILSVILGLYGIVVVAVITSIIVNFYNESRYIGKKEESKEEDKNKEENEK